MLPLTARTASQNNARPLKGKGIVAHDAKHVHESDTVNKKEIFKPPPQNDELEMNMIDPRLISEQQSQPPWRKRPLKAISYRHHWILFHGRRRFWRHYS